MLGTNNQFYSHLCTLHTQKYDYFVNSGALNSNQIKPLVVQSVVEGLAFNLINSNLGSLETLNFLSSKIAIGMLFSFNPSFLTH